jgi:branched-subunit amino acid aminotransferase/4-amino-4-deoxychorismate lyase
MIWCQGRILDDAELAIPATDRTFEHGLGLFETLRTWNGQATLLEAHKARMLRSAEALGIPLRPETLPSSDDVARLLEAEGNACDRVLRITASGGSIDRPSVVWLRTRPLPPAFENGLRVAGGIAWVDASHDLARHKSLNYLARGRAYESAREQGFDEAILHSAPVTALEGSRSNLFVVDGRTLRTASLDAPIVPGIMRGLVIAIARELGIAVIDGERGISFTSVREASEAFLTNSVRGIMPIAMARMALGSVDVAWPAPGPVTRVLQQALLERLHSGASFP